MKAAVTIKTGPPSTIEVREVPIPESREDWILIKIEAFGLNRSELFTRRGDSPNVRFPRIQGIECVGQVEDDPSGTYKKGQQVAAIMGEMGREYDGGYAEYTLVPLHIVFPFDSDLSWEILGAIPEMFQTVSGSLYDALNIRPGEMLLIRGGTSSIGMTACQLAKKEGLTVISTTRNEQKSKALIDNGSDHVLVDDGKLSDQIRKLYPKGVDKVLELVGTKTLKDSLQCTKPQGIVCMTGILGNSWSFSDFTPMSDIPSTVKLTSYSGEAENLTADKLQKFINAVKAGDIHINIDRIFSLDEIVEAHQYMEDNKARGKLVVKINQ